MRFLTAAAAARHSARSRAQVRRSLYGRHACRRARHIADVLALALSAEHRQIRRSGRGCNGCCATSGGACSSSIRLDARSATSLITTISTGGSTRSFSMPTGNIAAPISRAPNVSLDDAQLAKKRHLAAKLLVSPASACSDIGSAGAGSALYLAEICGRDVDRRHAVAGAARRRQRRAPRKRTDRERRRSGCRTTATSPARSTASCRSACSSMSASVSTTRSSASAPQLLADDGVMLLHSIGRSDGRASPIPGSRNTSSPAATSRRCRRCCPRSSGPACS